MDHHSYICMIDRSRLIIILTILIIHSFICFTWRFFYCKWPYLVILSYVLYTTSLLSRLKYPYSLHVIPNRLLVILVSHVSPKSNLMICQISDYYIVHKWWLKYWVISLINCLKCLLKYIILIKLLLFLLLFSLFF